MIKKYILSLILIAGISWGAGTADLGSDASDAEEIPYSDGHSLQFLNKEYREQFLRKQFDIIPMSVVAPFSDEVSLNPSNGIAVPSDPIPSRETSPPASEVPAPPFGQVRMRAQQNLQRNLNIRTAEISCGQITHMLQFPTEILLHMFSFVDKKDIGNIRLTCHLFNDIVCLYNPKDYWQELVIPKPLSYVSLLSHVSTKFIKSVSGFSAEERYFIYNLLHNLPNIEHISLKGCVNIPTVVIESLVHIPSIKSLDLSFCGQVSDDTVKEIARLPELKELYLDSDILITKDSMEALSQAKKLETLSLRGIYLSQSSIIALTNSRSLKKLYVGGMHEAPQSMPTLLIPLRGKLIYLDLSYISNIDLNNLRQFLAASPEHITVNLKGVKSLTSEHIVSLINDSVSIEYP